MALLVYKPKSVLAAIATIAVFKVVTAFAGSARTGVSHHIRFLLAGNNPIGMVGGASMMLGAVDSIFDWRDDTLARKKSPWLYWWTTLLKFATTPLGAVLFALELLWDLLLLGRGVRIWKCKWLEFFSLADYHDLICPEKSNDIFYADLANARYCDNVLLYQWNRMRAMVFELQHYKLDVENRIGSNDSNLFRVGDVAAYQILKRLEIERIEEAIRQRFEVSPENFPIPTKLATRLVAAARPLEHYLRMRRELIERDLLIAPRSEFESAFAQLVPRCFAWQVQRLFDASVIDECSSRYVTATDLERLVEAQILSPNRSGYRFADGFITKFERLIERHLEVASEDQSLATWRAKIPRTLSYAGHLFVPRRASASAASQEPNSPRFEP